MQATHFQLSRNYRALVRLLILGLLFAQWSGFHHRIIHGVPGYEVSGAVSESPLATSAASRSDAVQHSCAAFDAATLAATVHSMPIIGPLLPNLHVSIAWIAFVSRPTPFVCHFLSRAPPASFGQFG